MATPRTGTSARINDKLITLLPKETLLEGALRSGIDFPNGCRVGGCGRCKCRVADGTVIERTDSSYLLSADEIDAGYVLGCQSVPTSDVSVEVPVSAGAAPRMGTGCVVDQRKLTHDITRLEVKLDEVLDYQPGQFAQVSFDEMPGVVRNYSFATPPSSDGKVVFFVRRVPGGQFSTLVNDHDVKGKVVSVLGPQGDFWLRDSEAPLMMIAGGSGLAPILAMLSAALRAGATRSTTLLFGAREKRDLYALDEISRVARSWRGQFKFIVVLSEAANDESWRGERGLVTERIPALLEPGAHAYVCGPPAMTKEALSVLQANGVARADIHLDAFTTRADALRPATPVLRPREDVSAVGDVFDYLKYFVFHVIGLVAIAALVAGGWHITAGLVGVTALYVLGDALCGDDTSTPTFRRPGILTAQLWLALPLLCAIVFASIWSVSAGDPLGFGAWVSHWSGYDALAARAAVGIGGHVAGWALTGLMIGMVGTVVAHELTHRTWDPVSMFIGRWMLAFSFDTSFAIEHVYGHHRYVSTTADPATAPRGRNVYAHIIASTIKGNLSAWKIETARLAKKRRRILSLHNAFLRGQLMSGVLLVIAYELGGVRALAYFVACALLAKALLEVVNYVEHYGLVRDPSKPVEPRHSWNTNRRISSWALFNLSRHSHHHAQGEVPYHDLRPYPEAPMMISGYLSTMMLALVPPLWDRLMTPHVLDWDRAHATAEERALAAHPNAILPRP